MTLSRSTRLNLEKYKADPPPNLIFSARSMVQFDAIYLSTSSTDGDKPVDGAKVGTSACAAASNNAHKLATVDIERDISEGFITIRVELPHIFYFKNRPALRFLHDDLRFNHSPTAMDTGVAPTFMIVIRRYKQRILKGILTGFKIVKTC